MLWTIQPPEVVDIIYKERRFVDNPVWSEYYKEFAGEYHWIVTQRELLKVVGGLSKYAGYEI